MSDWLRKLLLQSVIVLLLLFGGGVALYLFTLYPLQAELDQVEDSIQQKEKAVQILTAELQARQEAEFPELEGLLQRLPTKPIVDQFLLTVDEMEKRSGSRLLQLSVQDEPLSTGGFMGEEGEEEGGQQLHQLTLQFQLVAPDYPALEGFIHQLENQERIAWVTSLQLDDEKRYDEMLGGEGYHYSLILAIYYLDGFEQFDEALPQVIHPQPAGKQNPFQ